MFFRALTMFRFPITLSFSDLEARLQECGLKPVGPLELISRGFISPFGAQGEALCQQCGDALWLAIGGEERLLPQVVIDKALQERLDEISARTGRTPGGRGRRQLRDEIVTDLLPKSHVRPTRTDALIDMERGVIAVDTASRRAAESVVSQIREAVGSFPALPLNAETSVQTVLTGWLSGDAPMPDGLSLGEDCTLEDPGDAGSKVKCYRVELRSDEIAEHLHMGRRATRLALTLDDHVTFELDELMVVRKFQLLDGAVDRLEQLADRDDINGELQARFALLAGEFGRMFDVLEGAFQLSRCS